MDTFGLILWCVDLFILSCLIYYFLVFFNYHFTIFKLMVFYWDLNDRKSHNVFRILLIILAVFNNALVYIILARSLNLQLNLPSFQLL